MQGIHCAAVGRLAADAALQYTSNGTAVLNFSLAVPSGKEGDDEVQWLRCSAWADLAEELNRFGKLIKGAECYVEGRLRLNEWQAQDGSTRHGLTVSCWTVQPMGVGQHKKDKPEQDTRPMGAYPQRGRRNTYQGIKSADGYRQPTETFAPADPPTTNPWR